MQKIFRAEGLPVELAFAVVESSFNVRAAPAWGSRDVAVHARYGKKFLRIDTAVDERRDPLASTTLRPGFSGRITNCR
jgi:hypothetical protein